MEPTENEDANKIQDDFEENLKKLACPFTWDMDDIDETISTEYKPHDEEEFIPMLKLMRVIMTVYVQTKEGQEQDLILTNLEKCDEIMVTLTEQSDPQFSTKAVYHVVQATLCHVLWKFDRKERAKLIFKEIKDLKSMDKIERSTINACRSIGWSKYHVLGSEEAVDFIRRALIDNPKCDLWHFILGKNLRRIRRDLSVGSIPTEEESDAFLKAYEGSKNVVYGIFLAQMYREERKNAEAIRMYQEIFKSKPNSHTIYLRLALGFIQLYKMPLAKECLDIVAVKHPEDRMYLHYRGHYYMKLKKYKEAVYYLKKSADLDNFIAAKSYLRCMVIVNPSFDSTQYLLRLIERYKNLPEKQIQNLLLDTAFSYLWKQNIKKSLKFFLHSIEIDSKSQALKEYHSSFTPGKSQNIYQELAKEVFPLVEQQRHSLDENTLESFDELKSYYEEYLEDEIQFTQNAMSKVRT